MIDIKVLRDNPEAVKENIKKKFQDSKLPLVDEVIELDVNYRKALQRKESLQADKNKISKSIGAFMAQGKKDEALKLYQDAKKKYVNAMLVQSGEIDKYIERASN